MRTRAERLAEQALDHALAYWDQVEDRAEQSALVARSSASGSIRSLRKRAGIPPRVLDYVGACIDAPGFATTSRRASWRYIPGGGRSLFGVRRPAGRDVEQIFGLRLGQPRRGADRECLRRLAGRASSAFRSEAAGTLTSGGSIANLTAVVAAREARDPDGGGAVYVTRFAHYCVDKALHIAGRGRSPKRVIATDESYRMSVEALEQALEEDRRNGIRPWLVVASAGTVDTGAIDPLPEIAELCRRYGAWLHVDGAYGGPVRSVRRGPSAASRHRAGRQRRARSAQDPVPALRHRRRRGPRRQAAAGGVQRQRRLHPAARRVRSRPVARGPFARADPPLSRAAPVAAAADRRRRRIPRRAVGEACTRPLFPCAPVGDRRLRPRPRAAAFGRRLPLPARRAATSTSSTSG